MEEIEVVEEIEVKPTIEKTLDPEFNFCEDEGVATLYCSGLITGSGKYSKTIVSCIILNNIGEIVETRSKYIGEGLNTKEVGIYSTTFGLENAKCKHYNKVHIYTDYTIPNTKEIKSFAYDSPKHQWDFNVTLRKFEEYKFIKIARKLNIVTVRLAEEEHKIQKLKSKERSKQIQSKKNNDMAFANRNR
jgi:hypothetical protein